MSQRYCNLPHIKDDLDFSFVFGPVWTYFFTQNFFSVMVVGGWASAHNQEEIYFLKRNTLQANISSQHEWKIAQTGLLGRPLFATLWKPFAGLPSYQRNSFIWTPKKLRQQRSSKKASQWKSPRAGTFSWDIFSDQLQEKWTQSKLKPPCNSRGNIYPKM